MDTEADIELFRASFAKLTVLCEGRSTNDSDLAKLFSAFNNVSFFASRFDFEGVRHNGFRSALHVVSKVMAICVGERPQDCDHVLRVLSFVLRSIHSCADINDEDEVVSISSSEMYFEFLREMVSQIDDFKHVLNPYCVQILEEDSGYYYKQLINASVLGTSNSFWDIFKKLINLDHFHVRAAEFAFRKGTTTTHVLQIMRIAGHPILTSLHRMVSEYYAKTKVCSTTVNLRLCSNFELKVLTEPQVEVIVKHRKDNGVLRTVRCRLYESNELTSLLRKYLIFHVHGGGFTFTRPESHEMCLLDYARKIPESAVLSVDYSLSPEAKYPRALQEIFDVYHWVTSRTQDVLDKLGFLPEKVVLTGDSAGSLALCALLVILVDIQRKWPYLALELPPLPVAFVSVYGAFDFSFSLYPSMVLGCLDCLVSPIGWFEAILCNSPIQINIQQAVESKYIAKDTLDMILKLQRHPYVNPINFNNFEALEAVRLVLISPATDIFVDTNVQMAKLWKGPKSLILVKGQPHTFLHMNGLSRSASRATRICIEQLQRCLSDDET